MGRSGSEFCWELRRSTGICSVVCNGSTQAQIPVLSWILGLCPRAQAAETAPELQQGNLFWRNFRNVAGWKAGPMWAPLLQGQMVPQKKQSSLDFSLVPQKKSSLDFSLVSQKHHQVWILVYFTAPVRAPLVTDGGFDVADEHSGWVGCLGQQRCLWCAGGVSAGCFSIPVTPHCPTQGEKIWGKANACIPVWAWVGLI